MSSCLPCVPCSCTPRPLNQSTSCPLPSGPAPRPRSLSQDHRRAIGLPLDVQLHEGRAAGVVLVHDLRLWLPSRENVVVVFFGGYVFSLGFVPPNKQKPLTTGGFWSALLAPASLKWVSFQPSGSIPGVARRLVYMGMCLFLMIPGLPELRGKPEGKLPLGPS